MCHEWMLQTMKIACTILAPLWREHGEDASTARSPEKAREYYIDNSKGKYFKTLLEVTSALMDGDKLAFMGFLNDKGALPPPEALKKKAALLEDQNSLAQVAFSLACSCLKHRMASMKWHDDGWPGLLALFASSEKQDQELAWSRMQEDWQVFQAVSKMSKGDPVLSRVARMSPFATTLVLDIATLVGQAFPF